jgi:integrase
MTKSTTVKSADKPARPKSKSAGAWEPPTTNFPLSYHPASGRLYKKIRGVRRYFGYADAWQAALEKYESEKEDWFAGRVPRERKAGTTVGDLCNVFLTSKKALVTSGELAVRSFSDYKLTTDRLVKVFGRNRLVEDLNGEDFALLRADICKGRGPIATKTEITRAKVVFRFAFVDGLVDKPVNYGAGFSPPKATTIRKALTANGPRMYEAAELRAIINKCPTPTLKAMVLLAANSGMGNHDVGLLPLSAVNLETGWVNFPRQKTGTERRFRMWPETIEAIKASLAKRPTPKPGNEPYVFLTRKGERWSKDNTRGVLSVEFKKVLDDAGITRPGAGYYDLRRTFQTVGEEAGETAIRYIMGHCDNSMSSRYRQRISDERLQAVTDHVRAWLFGKQEQEGGAA